MSGIKLRAHIKAMSSTMEVIIIASVIALIADTAWLSHDIYQNGMSLWYAVVGTGLVVATIMTVYALVKHHRDIVENNIKTLMVEKIASQKIRNRVKRHLELVRSRS